MINQDWKTKIIGFDARRDYVIVADSEAVNFCINQFLAIAKESIEKNGKFTVALSGGSTPKAIYQGLAKSENAKLIDWSKVYLFWSDERCVPPSSPESNYHMAMEAGFNQLPINQEQVFRMHAEEEIHQAALDYEEQIRQHVPNGAFDLVMLGVGEDGHTASLFPHTHALHTTDRLVIGNFIPLKDTWRMTFTYDCINSAHHIAIYALGKNKAEIVDAVLTGIYNPDLLPAQKVGQLSHQALWILDESAASKVEWDGV